MHWMESNMRTANTAQIRDHRALCVIFDKAGELCCDKDEDWLPWSDTCASDRNLPRARKLCKHEIIGRRGRRKCWPSEKRNRRHRSRFKTDPENSGVPACRRGKQEPLCCCGDQLSLIIDGFCRIQLAWWPGVVWVCCWFFAGVSAHRCEVCLAVVLFPNRRAGSDFENPEVYQQVVILRQMKNCWVTCWNYFPKNPKKSSSRLSKEKLI